MTDMSAPSVSDVANPERCRNCGGDSRVIESRAERIARLRERCCKGCGRVWKTWESLIDPERVKVVVQDASAIYRKV